MGEFSVESRFWLLRLLTISFSKSSKFIQLSFEEFEAILALLTGRLHTFLGPVDGRVGVEHGSDISDPEDLSFIPDSNGDIFLAAVNSCREGDILDLHPTEASILLAELSVLFCFPCRNSDFKVPGTGGGTGMGSCSPFFSDTCINFGRFSTVVLNDIPLGVFEAVGVELSDVLLDPDSLPFPLMEGLLFEFLLGFKHAISAAIVVDELAFSDPPLDKVSVLARFLRDLLPVRARRFKLFDKVT